MALKLESDARALQAPGGFAWLAEIEVPLATPKRLRVTTDNTPTSFGQSLEGDPVVYTPWPMAIGAIVRQKKGDLPQLALSVSNAKRSAVAGISLSSYLNAYNGLVGQPAVIQLVSLAELDNADASIRFEGQVQGSELGVEQINFTLGTLNLKGLVFPAQRFIGDHCRFRFGGPECGYNLNHPDASFSTCPRTFAACEERGDDEEDVMNVVRQHPLRFGGWRGIPLGE